jgi:uncharacterized repeat protein (TIGR02543 family)
MKKRIVALLLCCVMLLTLSPSLIATATADDETTPAQTEVTVSPAKANLPRNKKVTLTAQAKDAKSYQWQIMAEDDLWVDISGETESTIQVSYAMVASLLDGNKAQLRCKTDLGTTDPATVTVTEAQAVAAAPAKAAPKAGTVTKEAEAINKAVVQASEGDADADAPVPTTYTILINYQFADGKQAAPSWSATVATGSTYVQDIQSPVVVGYTPSETVVHVNTSEAKTYTVTYQPAEVEFTVKHYQQNVSNDQYTLVDTETKKGYTEAAVGESLAKTTYEGFYSLLYDTTTKIAADSSTVVEIYYDRYYYLMNFDLDGGYGVEPIYARYGAAINVVAPTKPGYTFKSWTPAVPTTMPAENTSYKASWEIGTSGFTVVFWYQNANDDGYSVAGTYQPADVKPDTEKKSDDYENQNFTGRDTKHFTYNAAKAETVTVKGDGSTVLNVYYTRNTYTLKFRVLDCDKWFFHSHSDSCYKVIKSITAKYQADIHNNFPIKDGNDTIWWKVPQGTETYGNSDEQRYLGSIDTMPGENITFEKKDSESGAKIYYYVETINGAAGDTTYNGRNYKQYKVIDLDYSGSTNLTYREEFHPITGFTQGDSNPHLPKDGEVRMQKNNYLYYTRNSYNLKFYNYNAYVDGNGGSVQYEAPLSGYNFTPAYPANLEKNAYVFAGWYTTPGCYEGSEADLSTMTMPASDVILYAKWTPKTHTVKTYLTKDVLDDDGTPLQTCTKIPHGTAVENPPTDPTRDSYKFVGWFYISDTGEEKAFNFSMPVNRDLNLFAKWSSNTLMTYTIRYVVIGEDGTEIEIASPTTGSALAGTTKTFDAKTGTQLNKDYQSGYFPNVSSHSITIDIEDTSKNEFTFVYVEKPEVEYTVKYLEKGTENQLADPKTVTTHDAVVTETFKQITGYAPDAYQKQLVLAAEGNEIIFWYVKDDVHAPVHIIHWIQNIEGDGYTEYQSSTNLNGVIGTEYSETPLNIPGFKYNGAKSNPSGELTAAGLVLNLYYDRIEYPYEFRFLEQGTEKVLAEAERGYARYQAQVTQTAKDIPGYTLVSAKNQAINIAIEDPANVASKNVRTFYYTEQTVDIKYEVVGPTANCGTLDNYQESQLKVITGTVNGSMPTAADGFKFVGWYKNEACTESVNANWVANNKLTPGKTKNYGTAEKPVMGYEAATYYAKFDYDITDLTITKTYADGAPKDPNQSAVFVVTGGDLGEGLTVVLNKGNNFKVVIKGLKVGTTYTVTEKTGWTWRYTTDPTSQNSQSIQLVANEGNNTITFTNKLDNNKWLTGGAWCDNVWGNNRPDKSTSPDYSTNR